MNKSKIVEINKWRFCLRVVILLIALLPAIFVQSQTKDSTDVFSSYVSKKNFNKAALTLDLAIQDKIPGLLVVGKSGMPDEGAYMSFRGIHTFTASNAPLIVLNGVPYMGNEDISNVINGYSRSLFAGLNVDDIKSVKLLKGAEAAMYGSLASNGVLLIQTEQATSNNLETRISYSGQYGMRMPNRTIPVMGVSDYKNYLQDIGTTRYGSLSSLVQDYPFLQNSDNYYSYLTDNNTDWNSLIQSPAFVTNNVFRVEGGDAIAKYNMSFGYSSDGGVLGKTRSDRYNTLINTNIMVSRDVDIFANVGLMYITSQLQNQGMSEQTNPLLAASLDMPMLSPYKKEPNGDLLNGYASYNEWNVNPNPTYAYDNVSNPLAIVNTVAAADKIYDINIKLGLNYHVNHYLTITGLTNLYVNYTEESIFIPGVTDKAIIPQYFGVGYNSFTRGVTQNKSNFYGLKGVYNRTFNKINKFRGTVGVRYITQTRETDIGSGYNTPNDFFTSLNYVTEHPLIQGGNIEWKWMNCYLNGDYTFNKILKGDVNVAVDGSSVSGVNAPRFNLFPSLGLTAMLGNLKSMPKAVSLLNITADVSHTGNSRFSSNYAKNYYQSTNLYNLGAIIRENVPNTRLQCEKKNQYEVGLDLSLFKDLLSLHADYFSALDYDLLIPRAISSVYGSTSYYDNTGKISTQGMEIALNIKPIKTKNFEWDLGGTISNAKSKIVSLGNSDQLTIDFNQYNNDDAMIIMKKGESPYQFYGYKTNGIYSTTAEANASGLKNIYGNPVQAGDVKYVNVNNTDNVINAKDKVLLGSATPDFFGNINTTLRYKNVSLTAFFGYSVGNKAYNAVRRELESMSTFHNQSISVLNRWQVEGQNATLPKAVYGDPNGNDVFSDRWIEDASYIKLRNLKLQYDFGKVLNLCQSGSVYITGENVLTLTHYLGGDPEFSYSYSSSMQGFDYAKVTRPRTIQVGFQLYF